MRVRKAGHGGYGFASVVMPCAPLRRRRTSRVERSPCASPPVQMARGSCVGPHPIRRFAPPSPAKLGKGFRDPGDVCVPWSESALPRPAAAQASASAIASRASAAAGQRRNTKSSRSNSAPTRSIRSNAASPTTIVSPTGMRAAKCSIKSALPPRRRRRGARRGRRRTAVLTPPWPRKPPPLAVKPEDLIALEVAQRINEGKSVYKAT